MFGTEPYAARVCSLQYFVFVYDLNSVSLIDCIVATISVLLVSPTMRRWRLGLGEPPIARFVEPSFVVRQVHAGHFLQLRRTALMATSFRPEALILTFKLLFRPLLIIYSLHPSLMSRPHSTHDISFIIPTCPASPCVYLVFDNSLLSTAVHYTVLSSVFWLL